MNWGWKNGGRAPPLKFCFKIGDVYDMEGRRGKKKVGMGFIGFITPGFFEIYHRDFKPPESCKVVSDTVQLCD
jgi:hypothetical protein